MTQFEIGTLGERLDRLERENRRLKLAGIAITAGSVLLLFCGAGDAEKDGVINCERFFLTNKAEGTGIAMGASADGEPVISFRRTIKDKTYSMDLRMFVAGDGVPVLLFEDQGKTIRYKIPR